METFRKYFFIILLAVIIGIVWGGVLIYSRKSFSSINPNAEKYTATLSPTFNEEALKSVSERIDSAYAIPPSSFFEMTRGQEVDN